MRLTKRALTAAGLAVALGAAIPPATSAADGPRTPKPYRIVWDDFSAGFSATGPDAKWSYLAIGPFVADDGRVSTSRRGLRVAAPGANPHTGQPAFTKTLGQADPSGLPGGLDHVKWLAYTNHQATTGFAGFDAVPGQELSCSATISGRSYGTAAHPFGGQVADHADDLRLASVGMPVQDPETDVVFDFFVTNERVYAFYERLPHLRTPDHDYAAFLHTVPVARRVPGQEHEFTIAYDRAAGVARWVLDGREVFRVDKIGLRLPGREHLMLDHGGVEERVAPRQLTCGMGMFTILDGALPGRSGTGLVRLTPAANHYFDPLAGAPTPQRFLDDASLASNRLFGQGAAFTMSRMVVSSLPSRP
ncbi:DUF6081 family protein [Actinokineospora iranica]|uniref:Secreted protein n=1 Tax=Actinokineospora iranica TaxID=1271860 RepID=A0A1G6S5U9_9PSEU|nr:DUF6081 family protein [Actinokineospora iranica]SDD12219.1 hypothetical protein SAMN05216174_107243 [Actinokineospora iranica]